MIQSNSTKPGLIHGLGLVSIVFPLTASAQSTWNGGTSVNWNAAANWSPGIPAADANIIIADTTTNGLTLNDGSHSVGSISVGTTGTRISGFTLSTTTANNLTIKGDVTAAGNFTAGIGLRFRGNTTIATNQTWQVGGQAGNQLDDRGLAINEVASSGVAGSLTLNANLSKSGTGQLTIGTVTVTGVGDINVNEGALKLNAGGSLPLTIGTVGTGKIAVNNSAALILSQNSGTFAVTRPIQFSNTANLVTGSGSNSKTGTFEIASNIAWIGTNHTITNNRDANNSGLVNFRLSGVMSGTGNLSKGGLSGLILSGTAANTLSGNITITQGELSLDKTGVIAVPGNITVAGGTLRINQANQIADASGISVTSGAIAYTAGRAETIASLAISSATASNVSGLNVTGATTLTGGTHDVSANQAFTTSSLAISNNAGLRLAGDVAGAATANSGAGGLNLNSGKLVFENNTAAATGQFNLSSDLISTGASQFVANNNNGSRVINLQGASRAFTISSGTLEIRPATEDGINSGPSLQNGTVVKSGAGTLVLSQSTSSADLSLTDGPVQVRSEAGVGNFNQSGGSLLMDIGGATPAKLTTSGNFSTSGGTIEVSAANLVTFTGTRELVRYNGSLTGTPVVNIPAALAGSRVNPVVNYGTGSNSAITITSTALPIALTWSGSNGAVWNNNSTANFNGGLEKFYPLDSVTFGDAAAASLSVVLNTPVFPTDVAFNHGNTTATYTLSGTGSISGATKLTKDGTGTTILATDNNYTGITNVLAGTLQVGNGGLTGSLGTGAVQVASGASLKFARSGYAVVGNSITGAGIIENSGPGTVALTANNDAFLGGVTVSGGTLQVGDGGETGSLGTVAVEVASGATFAIKRGGTVIPNIANNIYGDGSVALIGGSANLTSFNSYSGGVSVSDGGVLRTAFDGPLGLSPSELVPNAVRLTNGGLKNLDSDTALDPLRGIAISGEAYFTAGWSKSLTIPGPISGTGNVFINYDSGKVYFTNANNTWNGALTLGGIKPGFTGATGGILEVNGITNGGVAGPIGAGSADPANLVFNGGRLVFNDSLATGANTTDRGFTVQGSGTIEVTSPTLTITGKATGTGNLTKAGTGKLVLGGNSDFIGEKIISAGTVVAKSTTAFGDTGSFVRFTGTTGVLDLATNSSVAAYPVTIPAGSSGTILSDVATPGPGITHVLGNADLSTVTLNVAAGENVAGGDPRIALTSLGLAAGAAGTTTLNPTTANITLGSASISPGGNFAKTLALGGTAVANQVTGSITDGLNVLSLTKVNNSLWTISGDSTFTGNVTVDDGVLVAAHTNALGSAAKTLIIAGDAATNRIPEFRLTGGISPTVANVQISGAGENNLTGALRNISGDNTLNVTTQVTMRTGNGNTTLYSDAGTLTINTPLVTANATGRALTLAGPGNGVINGVIANGSTGALPVTKSGTGTWTLNGAHTYTGATTVNEGVLSLSQMALSDTAPVTIVAGAVLNLNFSGTDRVGSLTINGVAKADGVYSASTDPGYISGSGSIRVGAGPAGYSSWASSYPFTVGVNDGPEQDADGDGISNVLEYVLGGIPAGAGANNTSILPTVAASGANVVLTFRRSDVSETDVTLKVQWSDGLGTWNDFATIGAGDALPAVDVTEDSPNASLDTVVVTIPKSTTPSGHLFVRLQATKN
ncbi:autotransporter-associated beta strand repeat-containing protein [Luteolibacter sp. Y139]|uniref:Autotransporter-associated beta strand repeat-containing protein n=1 Tax=Luteolibacter soli TaxID=3135280 RepID=A0ABU9AUS7_9BACT